MNVISPILFFIFTQFSSHSVDRNVSHVKQLATEKISLEKRYEDKYVNDIFKDNILLNISYLAGKVTKKEDVKWSEVEKPISYKFTLLPNKTFAFHGDILDKYKNSVAKTTNANFNFDDGFKSDGYLAGDGVCHLASLIYWVSKEAGLDAYAPANHDFRQIPEISKEYGVAIYKMPGQVGSNAMQNLYVTNNRNKPIIFEFAYNNKLLKISVFEETL